MIWRKSDILRSSFSYEKNSLSHLTCGDYESGQINPDKLLKVKREF